MCGNFTKNFASCRNSCYANGMGNEPDQAEYVSVRVPKALVDEDLERCVAPELRGLYKRPSRVAQAVRLFIASYGADATSPRGPNTTSVGATETSPLQSEPAAAGEASADPAARAECER
jgi:hypothetical protein